MQTKYHHFETTELLSMLAIKRIASPVIEELCQRLEKSAELTIEALEEQQTSDTCCPICDATLKVGYTEDTKQFTLTYEG